MFRSRCVTMVAAMLLCAPVGCGMGRKGTGDLQKPPRAAELDSYAPFVGKWTWTATMEPRGQAAEQWEGTSEWKWTLDQRVLSGAVSGKSGETSYDAEGLWGYSTNGRRYVWGMVNNWGHCQGGTARYDAESQEWRLTYRGTGFDGTTSYGRYTLRFTGPDVIDWRMQEWADPFHLICKVNMHGTYTRKR